MFKWKDLTPQTVGLATILAGLTIGLGYWVEQSNFFPLVGLYALFFCAYLFIYNTAKPEQVFPFWIAIAIGLRLMLVFAFPNLSDDVYRFIWDGRLWLQGQNPFNHLPTYYLEPGNELPGLSKELFNQLNSQEYFTIYPPVAQLTFVISTWLFPNSIYGSAVLMKLFLLGFEIGNLWLIRKLLNQFQLPEKNVLLYALNPLILVEITGNLHFEGGMIFFLLLGIWLLTQQQWVGSAASVALSVASKLLPLMFFPFWIRRLGLIQSIRYFILVGIVLIGLFLPLFSGAFLESFGSSLNLYFQRFEFNASIYYIFRWIGYQRVGYNMIATYGPLLSLGTVVGILLMALFDRDKSWKGLFAKMLFAITLYLAFTATVHPWYISLPLVCCLFTSYRFPVLWSGVILLTYINYSYGEYYENLWVVALEYTLVYSFLIWELIFKPKTHKSNQQLMTNN